MHKLMTCENFNFSRAILTCALSVFSDDKAKDIGYKYDKGK